MSEIFGERLKEERARLGLSQSAFAKRLGIHRNTQIKYESGERYPDSSYMDASRKIGVDIYYLHSGIREENRENHHIAADDLARGVYEALGFTRDEVRAAELELAVLVDAEFEPGGGCCEDGWESVTVPRFVSEFLSRSPVLSMEKVHQNFFSADLLTLVLEGIEGASSACCQQITPAKKAQAAAMLYRAFKASGKVDKAMIEEAVKLAAG